MSRGFARTLFIVLFVELYSGTVSAQAPDSLTIRIEAANVIVTFPSGSELRRPPSLRTNIRPPNLAVADGNIVYKTFEAGDVTAFTPATIAADTSDYDLGSGDEWMRFTPDVYAGIRQALLEGTDWKRHTYTILGDRPFLVGCDWHEPGGALALSAFAMIDDVLFLLPGRAAYTSDCSLPMPGWTAYLAALQMRKINP